MKLVTYLQKNGMVDREFADLLTRHGTPITRSSVGHWCRGERRPMESTMQAIERITGGQVTPRDFANAYRMRWSIKRSR